MGDKNQQAYGMYRYLVKGGSPHDLEPDERRGGGRIGGGLKLYTKATNRHQPGEGGGNPQMEYTFLVSVLIGLVMYGLKMTN